MIFLLYLEEINNGFSCTLYVIQIPDMWCISLTNQFYSLNGQSVIKMNIYIKKKKSFELFSFKLN